MDTNNDKSVLNNIYQNAQAASHGISDLMPKITNSSFRDDLKQQDSEYRSIQQQATQQLIQMGDTPSEIGPLQRAGVWASMNTKTIMNADTSHLAEVMITGSNMGITNMTKILNTYQNPNPQVQTLAQQLITTEQQHVERLKTYLN